MAFIYLDEIKEKELFPGFWGRFVHSEHMTLASWRIEAGSSIPLHAHPQEQLTTLLEGEFEFTIAGETHLLKPGMVLVIPSNVQHKGKALVNCKIIDIFNPTRPEYNNE